MKRTVIFRCTRCGDDSIARMVWQSAGVRSTIGCSKCGASFPFDPRRDRKHSDEAYFEYARDYATRAGIDLTLAYSVLEGIMSLRQARASVARAQEPERTGSRFIPALVLGLAALLLAIPAVHAWRVWSKDGTRIAQVHFPFSDRHGVARQSDVDSRIRNSRPVLVRTNELGNPIEVEGRDPERVLVGYCRVASSNGRLEPLGVVPGPPPHSDTRYGLFLDFDDLGATRAIRIYHDPRVGAWVSGDGTGVIVPVDAPHLRPESPVKHRDIEIVIARAVSPAETPNDEPATPLP